MWINHMLDEEPSPTIANRLAVGSTRFRPGRLKLFGVRCVFIGLVGVLWAEWLLRAALPSESGGHGE